MSPLGFDYPISVAVLYYGGESGDLQDTEEAVGSIAAALERRGHVVRTAEVNKKNWLQAVKLPGEVVFNLVEDELWELYTKVGFKLEEMGRAQVGHDMKAFKYVTKKSRVKRRLSLAGVPTPKFRIFNRRSRISQVRGLEFPVIIKPSGQHAGVGISQDSVVIDQTELEERVKFLFARYPGEVVAEEFVEGREVHVTVLGNGRHVVTLPACEVMFGGEFADNWSVYTYAAKWDKESWEYWDARTVVPKVSRVLEKRLLRAALKAYRVLGCRDIARIDIRVNGKLRPQVVDVNMNPSLNQLDDQDATVRSAEALGWSYEDLVETVVAVVYKRVYGRLPDRVRERGLLLAT